MVPPVLKCPWCLPPLHLPACASTDHPRQRPLKYDRRTRNRTRSRTRDCPHADNFKGRLSCSRLAGSRSRSSCSAGLAPRRLVVPLSSARSATRLRSAFRASATVRASTAGTSSSACASAAAAAHAACAATSSAVACGPVAVGWAVPSPRPNMVSGSPAARPTRSEGVISMSRS